MDPFIFFAIVAKKKKKKKKKKGSRILITTVQRCSGQSLQVEGLWLDVLDGEAVHLGLTGLIRAIGGLDRPVLGRD